ncbi:hypothetical protein NP590_11485 [Methylomonas sp. SURF-2]|uniref:Uncharacterized protein n=1 Tax=Methylomonas subterranea TaxID=2952225 RepID=A0ABT1TGY7_9GAMM|nr:hypothetical protein [Methylomonas sp. SURF-2]MCQ8104729.1 hypothetical protein [Methylomonas sp. SURF-2]
MAEFYVDTTAQGNGEHIVHFATCESLPPKEARLYLGSIASCGSALKKAAEKFKPVNACPRCAAAFHTA